MWRHIILPPCTTRDSIDVRQAHNFPLAEFLLVIVIVIGHLESLLVVEHFDAGDVASKATFIFNAPPSVGGLDLDSRSSGCARLGGGSGFPLEVRVFASGFTRVLQFRSLQFIVSMMWWTARVLLIWYDI